MELKKANNGWEARDEREMGETVLDGKPARRVLSVRLSKSYRGNGRLLISATVSNIQGIWSRHVVGYGTPSGDFSRLIEIDTGGKRVTQKAIRDAWAEYVEPRLDEIETQAREHYA